MPRQRSYCRLCPALCGILVTTQATATEVSVTEVVGDPDHPLSQGYTCPKGRSLPALHHHPARLEAPVVGRGEARQTVGWDELLDGLAATIRDVVEESGPDAVGMYVGTGSSFDGAGRVTTRRFMRALGSRSYYSSGTVDSPCKPLVAELMAGNAAIIPHGGGQTRLSLLVGLNPVISHGHLQSFPNPRRRLKELTTQGPLWVVDPRRTETAAMATRHLAPRPGTDHIWLAAVVRELLPTLDQADLRSRATGVEELTAAVAPFTVDAAAERCGITAAEIVELVADIRAAGRIAVDSGTGLTMAPGANVAQWLLWVLAVITDSFDHPDGMWFNPGLLHRFDRANLIPSDGLAGPGPRSRPELPERVGELPAAAIAEEIESGNLRVLIVAGGNLLTALPDSPRLRQALGNIEVLVVADVIANEMTDLATHVVPTTGQLERADLPWFDTISPAIAAQYTGAVVPPVAERRHLWQILGQLGARLHLDVLSGVDADTGETDDVLASMIRRSGIDMAELMAASGPVIDHEVPFGWVRAVLPKGGWRLAPQPLLAQLAALQTEPGLVLAPSRRMRHLNSLLTDEATSDGEREQPVVMLHPQDARAFAIADGDQVQVTSAHGAVQGIAVASAALRPGTVTVPHGFDSLNVNDLTSADDLDPLTGMPVFGALPVRVSVVAPAVGR